MRTRYFFAILLLVPVVYFNVKAQGLPDLGEASQSAFTPAMERQLGQSIMKEARRDPMFYDDPEVTDYVSRIGNRLAMRSGEVRQSFEFFLMRDPTINAFALPGGHIGVHTGLVTAAQSESEMAGVLGHEIAHVVKKHHIGVMQKQRLVSAGANLAASRGGSPASSRCVTPSTTTIASSTTMPIASTSPNSDRLLRL